MFPIDLLCMRISMINGRVEFIVSFREGRISNVGACFGLFWSFVINMCNLGICSFFSLYPRILWLALTVYWHSYMPKSDHSKN